jgi:ubiquitin carboxyl-terminal hydrolase 7
MKFEFGDVLDLETLLPNPPKGKSEITDTEIVNKYHLHSILVHRGTANAGHYYAFIKPTLEDSWYEFNDSKVSEVGRDYAFGQGIGGNLSSFEFIRQTMFKESTG